QRCPVEVVAISNRSSRALSLRSLVFGYTTKMTFWSPARLRCHGAPIWLRYRAANSPIRPMCQPPFIQGQKPRESHLDQTARLAHVQEAQPPGVHREVH